MILMSARDVKIVRVYITRRVSARHTALVSYRYSTLYRQRLIEIIWLQEATAYNRLRKDDKLRMQQQERSLACICRQKATNY